MKTLSLLAASPFWGMVIKSGPVVKSVILILIMLSILSWTVIILKFFQIKAVEREDRSFLTHCRREAGLKEILILARRGKKGVISVVFIELHRWLLLFRNRKDDLKGQWHQVVQDRILLERERLSSYVGFLATVGNTAPFIGLFGTVWGIMNAFQHIGLQGSASLAVVAPGISEALVTTALGLFAAIPAVMGYNFFTGKIAKIEEKAEGSSYILMGVLESRDEE